MGKYVFAYKGGNGMPATEQEQQAVAAAWGAWIGGLGDSLVDVGNPFGPSATVAADSSVGDGGSAGLSGYSIVTADDLAAAADKAKGCPVFAAGGTVEVYETIAVEM